MLVETTALAALLGRETVRLGGVRHPIDDTGDVVPDHVTVAVQGVAAIVLAVGRPDTAKEEVAKEEGVGPRLVAVALGAVALPARRDGVETSDTRPPAGRPPAVPSVGPVAPALVTDATEGLYQVGRSFVGRQEPRQADIRALDTAVVV